MSEEYQRRYGKKFIAFHNPTDIRFWQTDQRKDWTLGPIPHMLYAGRTGLGIDASLKTIARAVDRANADLGTRLKLILQTGRKPEWIRDYACVEHRPFVPYEELPGVFASADFLLLPYDFSEKAINFIRYSMPTKASEFMVSGSPILVFAPEDTAIVQYAGAYNWAKIVTENRVEALASAIRDLLSDAGERERLARRAVSLAEQRHEAGSVRQDFQSAIRNLVAARQVQTI
jgi:glycosyltransferase involved in cell wall biosynthesis